MYLWRIEKASVVLAPCYMEGGFSKWQSQRKGQKHYGYWDR